MTAGTKVNIAKNRTSLVSARTSLFDATHARMSTPVEGGEPAMRSKKAFGRKEHC
jgi:hypothetical protein